MSDDDIDYEEKFEALETRLDELEEQTKADDPDDPAKGDDGDGLEDKIDSLEEKLDTLAEASGKSQQLEGGGDSNDGPTKADILGLPGGDD